VQKKEHDIRNKFFEQPSDEVLTRQRVLLQNPGEYISRINGEKICTGKLSARGWLRNRLESKEGTDYGRNIKRMRVNSHIQECSLLVREAEEGYLRTKGMKPVMANRYLQMKRTNLGKLAKLQDTLDALHQRDLTAKPVIPLASNRASVATSVKCGGAAKELHCKYAPLGGVEKGVTVKLIWDPFPALGGAERVIGVEHGPVKEHCTDLVESLKQELIGLDRTNMDQITSYAESIRTLLKFAQGELIPVKCDDGNVHGCLTDESLLRHCRAHVLNADKDYVELSKKNYGLLDNGPIHNSDSSALSSAYVNSTKSILRTNAQVEYKGKVRVSTLHDASVTNTARSLTPQLLKLLNDFPEIAAGRASHKTLQSGPDSLLGCADISDATGNNTHQENFEWIGLISELNGLTMEERCTLQCLLGPQRVVKTKEEYEALVKLEERKFSGHISEENFISKLDELAPRTRQSSHMGIGVGWPFFCIKIAYLCYLAGVKPEELIIMGDDLTILAKPEILDRVIELLDAYRLPVNLRKSYNKCTSSVFCENMYTLYAQKGGDRSRFAKLAEILPLGQASMKRVREECGVDDIPNKRDGAMNLVRELNRRSEIIPSCTRLLGRKTARKYLRTTVAGPACVGGNGTGGPSKEQLAKFIISGSCATTKGNAGGRTGQRLRHLSATYLPEEEFNTQSQTGELIPAEALKTALQKEAIIVDRFAGAKMRKSNNTSDANLRAARSFKKKGEMLIAHFGKMKAQAESAGLTQKIPKSLQKAGTEVQAIYHLIKDSRCYSSKAKRLLITLLIQSPKRISHSASRSILRLRDSSLERISLEHYQSVINKLRPTQRVGGKLYERFIRSRSP